jgi:hypothetical protein
MDHSHTIPRRWSMGRRVCACLLVAAAASCTTVGPVDSPAKYIQSKQPRSVWLTRQNHSTVRVDGPRMLGDTVIGSVHGEYTEVPLSEVTRVSAMKSSKGKTIAAGLLGAGVTAGALVLIFSHSGSGAPCNPCPHDTLTLGVTAGTH